MFFIYGMIGMAMAMPKQIPMVERIDEIDETPVLLRIADSVQESGYREEWAIESDKIKLLRENVKFMDITTSQDMYAAEGKKSKKALYPTEPVNNMTLIPMMAEIDQIGMRLNLLNLTKFKTRYYKSEFGHNASVWLQELVVNITASNPSITVTNFSHPWGQDSIIAHIPGNSSNETVVIGAHMDTLNLFLPQWLPAPGADDDGSGVVTILEALKILSDNAFLPEKNVEFHFYAAEEGGLLGSAAVFQEYAATGREVVAMLQQDMTGYVAKGIPEAFGLVTDFVDPDLTEYLKSLITWYCTIPYNVTECGYACSDHASAARAGYPASYVMEAEMANTNPFIHTVKDHIGFVNFTHMEQHTRLSLAFAVELGSMK